MVSAFMSLLEFLQTSLMVDHQGTQDPELLMVRVLYHNNKGNWKTKLEHVIHPRP